MQHPIILASTSSTRIRILASANVAFEAQAALCDEQQLKSETKHLTTKELSHFLAEQKALSLAKSNHNSIIIGSDQVLEINNLRLDKVLTIEEARHQLVKLRGQTHHLYSSISCVLAGETIWQHTEQATLVMYNYSDAFLDNYLDACGDQILSSVGCYQIENHGIQLFSEIHGDYNTILGFPILPLLNFLRAKDYIPS